MLWKTSSGGQCAARGEVHMTLFLALLGGFLGFLLAEAHWDLLGLGLGAAIGWVIGAFTTLRGRFASIEVEVAEIRRRLAQRGAELPEAARPPEPAPPPPPRPAPSLPTEFEIPARAPLEPAVAAPAPRFEGPAAAQAQPEPATPPPWVKPNPWEAAGERSYESVEDKVTRALREYFTGGNTLVRVGIIILFIGVAFLVRYVAQRVVIAIELRLMAVAIGAIVLLVLGWRLRRKRAGYALALQGGAVGILYLTVFAALRLYALLPAAAAFALLVAISGLLAALAILQNSMAAAVLGVVGGFLAPILASTGQGSHIVLFSYYAVLNAGIFTIAWFRAWRPLNVIGFVFTFAIATAWGVLRYRSDLFASTEPFLILFFLFYLAIAVLYAFRQTPDLKGYVDSTLIFGTPVFAFGLQTCLLHDRRYALAFSALALSALYITLAWALLRKRRETLRLLVEAFLALGVAFLTLAIPLALHGHWSAASWALEGAALVWIGCRQDRKLPRISGALLQVGAGLLFWNDVDDSAGEMLILNSGFIGGVLISAATVFSSVLYQRYQRLLADYEQAASTLLFILGVLWWLVAGFTEIDRHVLPDYEPAAILVYLTATALISSVLNRRLGLHVARIPALALLPVMIAAFLHAAATDTHPLVNGGYVSWPLALVVFYWLCRRHEGPGGAPLANALHVGALWLFTSLVGWEAAWDIDWAVAGGGSWPAIGWVLVPALVLLALPGLGESVAWPFRAHRAAYVALGGAGIAAFVVLWSIFTNCTQRGDPAPLPYIPLLNPLDVAEGFALLALVRYALHVRKAGFDFYASIDERGWLYMLAALVFVWANAVLLRTLHHWAGVPFALDEMLRSTLVETSLSIFWTVLALAAMLYATRRARRIVWLAGGALLAVVVAKLFLVDLSRVGTVGRIVSFVGVGVLMLIIGYFSPLPPARSEDA
jgi:uncharacterized membrane protein